MVKISLRYITVCHIVSYRIANIVKMLILIEKEGPHFDYINYVMSHQAEYRVLLFIGESNWTDLLLNGT